jgi:hypothetical protein
MENTNQRNLSKRTLTFVVAAISLLRSNVGGKEDRLERICIGSLTTATILGAAVV